MSGVHDTIRKRWRRVFKEGQTIANASGSWEMKLRQDLAAGADAHRAMRFDLAGAQDMAYRKSSATLSS